jgi:hypothetical protein
MHHRGVLAGRAVPDGCGVDFSGNGGYFFGLGTARQRLARAAYFTAIDVARAARTATHVVSPLAYAKGRCSVKERGASHLISS